MNAQAGSELIFNVNQTSADGDCDVYINRLSMPTRTNWIRRDISTKKQISIVLGKTDTTEAGLYIAGVYGFINCDFSISGVNKGLVSCPKGCSGHGACGPTGVCTCSPGWTGAACDSGSELTPDGTPVVSSVAARNWVYYTTMIDQVPTTLFYNMTLTTSGDADLYIGYNVAPTVTTYLAANTTMEKVSTIELQITQAGIYYAGVLGFWAGSSTDGQIGYSLTLEADNKLSCHNTTRCSDHGTCTTTNGCICNPEYSGKDCEEKKELLGLGKRVTGYVADSIWNYYRYQGVGNKEVTVSLSQTGGGDCDLYVKGGSKPTQTSFDFAELGQLSVFNITIPEPLGTTWYIGVFGWSSCAYSLIVTNRDTKDCGHGTWLPDIDGCVCDPGWTGDKCSENSNTLLNGVVMNGTVTNNNWVYYIVNVAHTHSLEVRLKETNSSLAGSIWLYVSREGFPTLHTYDESDVSTDDRVHFISMHSKGGAWNAPVYVGVYGSPYGKTTETLSYSLVAWYPDFR